MSHDSLVALHTALIDAQNGYREAVKDSTDPALKSLFEGMIALHGRAHQEVHAILLKQGEKPNDDGSFMSTVHETVIAVRSAVAGLNEGALSSFASGEERIVSAYDKAIDENSADTSAAGTLKRQRAELQAKIDKMKRLAA